MGAEAGLRGEGGAGRLGEGLRFEGRGVAGRVGECGSRRAREREGAGVSEGWEVGWVSRETVDWWEGETGWKFKL